MLHSQQSKFALPTGKTYGILALNAELLSLLLRRLDVYFSTSPVVLRPDGAVIDAGSARRADLDIIIDYIQQSHTRIREFMHMGGIVISFSLDPRGHACAIHFPD
jgi:hypothetical protein